MLPDHTFDELLEAAVAGEPWACRALWERYAPGVASYARLRGSPEPEDLTSEVFLALFGSLSRFRGDEAGFRGYLYTIARRRLVDERRRRGARPAQVEWDPEGDRRQAPSAEELALAGLGDARVSSLLGGLAPDQREVLVLRLTGDLTVDQVAALLGKRPGAVKALQRRGLATLRRRLEAEPATTAPEGGAR